MSRLVIAIDGPAASGKGTLARRLAEHFSLPHLDTGLLYRATACALLDEGLPLDDEEAATAAARGLSRTDFDDARLRSREMGEAASVVAALPQVRAELVDLQRRFAAREEGAVLDGRDIGTVICPGARVKIFVTARPGDAGAAARVGTGETWRGRRLSHHSRGCEKARRARQRPRRGPAQSRRRRGDARHQRPRHRSRIWRGGGDCRKGARMTARARVSLRALAERFSPHGSCLFGAAELCLARECGGRFLLRIEDIDFARARPEFEAAIYEDLAWLGLQRERPVRIQSEHFAEYFCALEKLEALGLLYPCACTRADIARAAPKGGPRDPDGAPGIPEPAGTTRARQSARFRARAESRCGSTWRRRLSLRRL